MNFPDLPHLRQLQSDLWQWPRSRAAVMVGAGFSLNSAPLPGVHSHFPTWRQLVWAMYEELHPLTNEDASQELNAREDAFKSANVLRIASEYEAAFGRRKLNLLIRTLNPDTEHQPGILHQELMQLPWADVFTTNYDTLLERVEVPWRSYQQVTKAAELTTAFAPRIVKLHGSLPSQSPFIITEDDYRTYPIKFAPFVNSVQQSLIENAIVLLGFSGDDPNFLAWTGWIRDHLGENHAPIYLVGPLGLGNAERALLVQRGITPIDLLPIFASRQGSGNIHLASIRWFLKCLNAAKPDRPELWPESKDIEIDNTADFPEIIGGTLAVPHQVELSPDLRKPLSVEEVAKTMRRWKHERESYPRWLVATDEKRTSIWDRTKYWIQPLLGFSKEWTTADRVLLFREINWRIEVAMVPLFPETIEPFRAAIEQLFPSFRDSKHECPCQEKMPFATASNEDVSDAWFCIAFALIREARETYNESYWNELKEKIDQIVPRYSQYHDRNHYEGALWAMWKVEREEARTRLAKWQPSLRNPLALMWKAGLLAELDELGETQSILRAALGEIRKALNIQGRNIELLSLEGWCTYLLFGVEQALDLRARPALRMEFTERWHELKAWNCDPWQLKEYFNEALKAPKPVLPKEETKVHGFDPDEVTLTRHYAGNHADSYLPAFGCIRLQEQVGLPMRMRMLNVGSDALVSACRWIAPFVGFGSPAVLIRAGKPTDITEADFMSRTQVACMDVSAAYRLHHWCLEVLNRELASLKGVPAMNSAQETLLEVLPEILSRLAFRMDVTTLRESYSLAVRFHQHSGVRAHLKLHKSTEPWFRRLFFTADKELLMEWLPELLGLPLFDGQINTLIPKHFVWPDPMSHFPSERIRSGLIPNPDLRAKVSEAAEKLIHRIFNESDESRRRGEDRLLILFRANLLAPDQEREFAKLLWEKKSTTGLPDRPDLSSVSYLLWPAPEGVDVRVLVKAYILELPPQYAVEKDEKGNPVIRRQLFAEPTIRNASLATKPLFALKDERQGTLEWTDVESEKLYRLAISWWNNDKTAFDLVTRALPFQLLSSTQLIAAFKTLGHFLSRAVLPYMTWAKDEDWKELFLMIEELRTHEVYLGVPLPYILIHRPSEFELITNTVAGDLVSDSDERVAAAAEALRHWAHLAFMEKVPSLPLSLILSLIERVIFRETLGIESCLDTLARLLLERPEIFTKSQLDLVASSLVSWHRVLRLGYQEDSTREFDELDKPDLRVLLGRLSSAMKIWFALLAPEEPENAAIKLWRESCETDPLPEVRRSFEAWADFKN